MQRLRRSRRSRLIAGVCGGIGERYGIPPFVVRLAFIVGLLVPFWPILLYVVGWLLIPEEPDFILDPPYETSGEDGPTEMEGLEGPAATDRGQDGDGYADSWERDEGRGSF